MNISDGYRGAHLRVRKPWHQLMIVRQVAVLVGEDSWDRGVCWTKSIIVSAFGEHGVLNLMEIREASMSVGDIWSRL